MSEFWARVDDRRLSEPAGGTALLDRTETFEQVEEGDHDRFAHYVRKEKILESAVSGMPVRALCGKIWIPGRDPDRFPVCPTCREIYSHMRPGGGDDKDKPAGQ